MAFSPIKKLLQDIKSGKMVVLMDDENRENEGDLICAAEMVTKESINFMAKFGKGLICLPLSNYYAEKLELAQMASHNTDNHETAFTISIDHLSTSTGISAEDRALTAKMVANDSSKAKDFRRPGHLFPLLAKEGGVLARNGHTEATVDLCRLAGLKECGLCCEIMAEDGSMMRKDELLAFAQKHDLAIATIKQLQDYRRQEEGGVVREIEIQLPTQFGHFTAYGYSEVVASKEHVEGQLVANEMKIGIVVSRFNELITSKLLSGAVDGLLRHGVSEEDIDIVWVPGAFEIPYMARKMALYKDYDAIICLGVVIKGSTDHYDYVCNEVTKGIGHLNSQSDIPHIFGVLTTDNIEQAIERAGTKAGNKGYDCALSAIEMVNLDKKLRER